MTAREVLDQIEQRADTAQRLVWALKYLPIEEFVRADVPKLAAALRAVLDLHKPATKAEADILDLDAGDCFDCWQETPCDTTKAITEALGADA